MSERGKMSDEQINPQKYTINQIFCLYLQIIGKLMYDDDFDDYLLDDYNDQLNDLEDQEQFAYDMYESEVNEVWLL